MITKKTVHIVSLKKLFHGNLRYKIFIHFLTFLKTYIRYLPANARDIFIIGNCNAYKKKICALVCQGVRYNKFNRKKENAVSDKWYIHVIGKKK